MYTFDDFIYFKPKPKPNPKPKPKPNDLFANVKRISFYI